MYGVVYIVSDDICVENLMYDILLYDIWVVLYCLY